MKNSNTVNEGWESELKSLLSRMIDGGLGKKKSLDGRDIWAVDDDEDPYLFAYETLIRFFSQAIKEERKSMVDNFTAYVKSNVEPKYFNQEWLIGHMQEFIKSINEISK